MVVVERNGKAEKPVWLKTDILTLTIDVAESDRGGITVHAFAVWKNRAYRRSPKQLNVPDEQRPRTSSSKPPRIKMEPGRAEEWRPAHQRAAKNGLRAEMVAAMYDASLDQFCRTVGSVSRSQVIMLKCAGNLGVFSTVVGQHVQR
ncbi:MAG: hypothetical protein IPL65_07410 [Lewinellaceae bacterium]|nr:hypothetical protein [Lewinellaceae bacterium]